MKKMKNVFTIVATILVAFLSGCKDDVPGIRPIVPGIRPTVVSSVPAGNAVGIAMNSNVTATFSVAMDPETITGTQFTLLQGTTAITGVVTSSVNRICGTD